MRQAMSRSSTGRRGRALCCGAVPSRAERLQRVEAGRRRAMIDEVIQLVVGHPHRPAEVLGLRRRQRFGCRCCRGTRRPGTGPGRRADATTRCDPLARPHRASRRARRGRGGRRARGRPLARRSLARSSAANCSRAGASANSTSGSTSNTGRRQPGPAHSSTQSLDNNSSAAR